MSQVPTKFRPRRRVGDIFMYRSETNDLIKFNNKLIKNIKISSVCDVMKSIRDHINTFVSDASLENEKTLTENIEIVDDITYKCVKVARWRRGTGFIFLQISSKDSGNARVSVYVTNTIHHYAECFGTTPGADEANLILTEYLADVKCVSTDLQSLKDHHTTECTVEYLFNHIVKT